MWSIRNKPEVVLKEIRTCFEDDVEWSVLRTIGQIPEKGAAKNAPDVKQGRDETLNKIIAL